MTMKHSTLMKKDHAWRGPVVFTIATATCVTLVWACGDDATGSSSATNGSSGSTASGETSETAPSSPSPSAEGSAACYAACDHQTEVKCENTPSNYNSACKSICDATYKRVPSDCMAERVLYDVCTRDKVTWTCVNRLPRLSPVGACAPEAQACSKCSPDAGIGCFSALF
jgi:hypothetical protein